MEHVLLQYGLEKNGCIVKPLGNGLINTTWLVETANSKYVLQRINSNIFKKPEDIAHNIRLIAEHLKKHHPEYLFTVPVKTIEGKDMVQLDQEYFRMFPFIAGSHTIDTVRSAQQAYEAAKQFGRFTRLLSELDISELRITLPHFHDLQLRYRQFQEALQNGNKQRIEHALELISFLKKHGSIVNELEYCRLNMQLRVTHHDTKISNVLFDEAANGLCVIDLDTVMPGNFISDVGDMMRTYLCPVSEEERDLSKIIVRKDFYTAIIEGYLSEMGYELDDLEKKYFHYSGKFMIYMQALRFLTDHLNNDVYYGAAYEGHNFNRAANQVRLLEKYMEIGEG